MYTVIPTEQFEKDVKYYVKKKGYIHIGKDIKVITDELEQGNLIGTVKRISYYLLCRS